MSSAKAVKRDNSNVRYLQGIPVYKCTECKKRFQTKAMTEQHIRREHGTPTK